MYSTELGINFFGDESNKKRQFNKIEILKKNIKNFLLDQNFVSGIGNIYASEILYLSKINAHEKIELAIRINITALTIKSALKKSFQREKSVAPPNPTA